MAGGRGPRGQFEGGAMAEPGGVGPSAELTVGVPFLIRCVPCGAAGGSGTGTGTEDGALMASLGSFAACGSS